jgi:hypothetical protein
MIFCPLQMMISIFVIFKNTGNSIVGVPVALVRKKAVIGKDLVHDV